MLSLARILTFILITAALGSCQWSATASVAKDMSNSSRTMFIIGDGGFMSNEPCGHPCFMGIIPGLTEKDEAISFLSDKIGLQNCEVWDRRTDGGKQGAVCDPPYLAFSFSDADVVEMLNFKPATSITAGEVVEKYGVPNRFSVGPYEDESGNVISVSMVILYDARYLSVGFLDQDGSTYNITESTLVNVVSYSDQAAYEAYLQKHATNPWAGYGTYEINDY